MACYGMLRGPETVISISEVEHWGRIFGTGDVQRLVHIVKAAEREGWRMDSEDREARRGKGLWRTSPA